MVSFNNQEIIIMHEELGFILFVDYCAVYKNMILFCVKIKVI